MTHNEWEAVAARLEIAWPPFAPERRAVYYEVLADVPFAKVQSAVEDLLLREDRERLPAPGVIRQRAVGEAAADPQTPYERLRQKTTTPA